MLFGVNEIHIHTAIENRQGAVCVTSDNIKRYEEAGWSESDFLPRSILHLTL